jgi:hypothetical protein
VLVESVFQPTQDVQPTFIRSNAVAYQAARAAFVFKGGHNRQEYEKALPYLVSFYTAIRKVSDISFDVDRAAHLELEWWIIHRERDKHRSGELAGALAGLSSELYRNALNSRRCGSRR